MSVEYTRASRPVLIVGSGRSGTTVLYELLCGHPDLAWFSNLADKLPHHPILSLAARARSLTVSRFAPLNKLIPSEGYRIWNACRPVDARNDFPLTELDASSAEVERTRWLIDKHVRYQCRSRFLNKNTRNTRRIRYLNHIFPDAFFIHVLRDPRATISSISDVAFWQDMPVWCRGGVTAREVSAEGGDQVALAAELWKAEVSCALEHKQVLPAARYLDLRYEDLMSDPIPVLRHVCQFAELPWMRAFEIHIEQFDLRSQNFKFLSRFTRLQLETIERIAGSLAQQFGYGMTS